MENGTEDKIIYILYRICMSINTNTCQLASRCFSRLHKDLALIRLSRAHWSNLDEQLPYWTLWSSLRRLFVIFFLSFLSFFLFSKNFNWAIHSLVKACLCTHSGLGSLAWDPFDYWNLLCCPNRKKKTTSCFTTIQESKEVTHSRSRDNDQGLCWFQKILHEEIESGIEPS